MWIFLWAAFFGIVLHQSEGSLPVTNDHQPSNGVNKGTWAKQPSFCSNSYAHGFKIKSDGAISSLQTEIGDKQGVTGLLFYCQLLMEEITSDYSKAGNWKGMYYCPDNSNVLGIRLSVNPNPVYDSLGVEDIQILCNDVNLNIIDGLYGPVGFLADAKVKEEIRKVHPKLISEHVSSHITDNSYVKLSDYGTWAICNDGTAVCGLETRVEDNDLIVDNLGLTDVIIYCCTP